jgi:hypothetical protein
MNSTEIVDLFRETVSDTVEPFLWSDTEAYRFLDDAQKMFCRLTGGLGDGSSDITKLNYTTSTDWIALSPLILKVRDASMAVTGREVEILNMEDMRRRGMKFNGNPGALRALVTGIEPGRVRIYPYPIESGVIQLIVDRLPLKAITDAGDQRLEVAEQHHQALMAWMFHRAYAKQDAETIDKKKSIESKFEFETYCFEAKAEKDRAMHKTRVVSYGGL